MSCSRNPVLGNNRRWKTRTLTKTTVLPSKLYVLYMKILWLLVFFFNLNKFYMSTNKITSPIGFLIKFKFKYSMNAKNKKSWSKLGWWNINKYSIIIFRLLSLLSWYYMLPESVPRQRQGVISGFKSGISCLKCGIL